MSIEQVLEGVIVSGSRCSHQRLVSERCVIGIVASSSARAHRLILTIETCLVSREMTDRIEDPE